MADEPEEVEGEGDEPTLEDELEELVDTNSLAEVLDALAQVCYEKAEHLRGNWQDRDTAAHWDKAGGKIDALGSTVDV
jgi:hypothetical protein